MERSSDECCFGRFRTLSAFVPFHHSNTPLLLTPISCQVYKDPVPFAHRITMQKGNAMRRIFLTSLLLSSILCGWMSVSFGADTIRIAYSSINPHALLVSLAEKRGLFAKYGLSSVVVYIPGGSTVVQTMISGEIDLGQLTGAPGVAANLRGADILYIAMTDDTMGYQLATRGDIKSAAGLKGKRLGISRFASSSDFGTRTLLKRLGVDPKEVTILQIGNEAERLAALKSGSIDGSIFNAPFGNVAKKFNFNILADAGALGISYFNTGMCG